MKPARNEIHTRYLNRVNVVFRNIVEPENQTLMNYFSAVTLPTKVLLIKRAKRFF
jgi:hypothetical protein